MESIPTMRDRDGDAVNSMVAMRGVSGTVAGGRFKPGDLILERYKVMSELGQGGIGVVYKCFDEVAGVEIALKALPPELSHSASEMEIVRNSFHLASRLIHQNIAMFKTLERDARTGAYYLIMEYVEGENLRDWIRRKRREGGIKLNEVVPIVRQIAEALEYAHKERVVHRDIKPGNIMITVSGDVKVLDFGLAAQLYVSMARVSMSNVGMSGIGPYSAPEQWQGRTLDAAADQYALASMAYEMLAGRMPFESMDIMILREAILHEAAPEINGVPAYVRQALKIALEKEPAARFASCNEFVSALEGKGVRIKTATARQAGGKWRWPSAFLLFVGFCAVGMFFGYRQIEHRYEKDHQTNVVTVTNTVENMVTVTNIVDWTNVVTVTDVVAVTNIVTVTNVTTKTEVVIKTNTVDGVAASLTAPLKFDGRIKLAAGVDLELVRIGAGSFVMGSPDSELNREDDETQRTVVVDKDFWIGKFEVTQEQYCSLVRNDGASAAEGNRCPVRNVSWSDAMAFCRKLTERYKSELPQGYEFSLPTEAQWEYACRAGTGSAFNNGSNDSVDLSEVAWYGCTGDADEERAIHPVGEKRANAWGLHDMHGNVWEWCFDEYNPSSFESDGQRVLRGGSGYSLDTDCRSARRKTDRQNMLSVCYGFRVALTAADSK